MNVRTGFFDVVITVVTGLPETTGLDVGGPMGPPPPGFGTPVSGPPPPSPVPLRDVVSDVGGTMEGVYRVVVFGGGVGQKTGGVNSGTCDGKLVV